MKNVVKNLGFSIYVAVCYLAIIGGNAYVDNLCYEKLKLNQSKDLVNRGLVTPITLTAPKFANSVGLKLHAMFSSDANDANTVTVGLTCAQITFLPKPLNMRPLLLLPGLAILILIFLIRFLLRGSYWDFSRGLLILFVFVIITNLISALRRYCVGLPPLSTMAAMGASFFYGAIFWWIDSFAPKLFDTLLDAINANDERLKLLYDYTKHCITLVIGLFISICVTLVWNISSVIENQYAQAGLAQILMCWMLWLTFWFSLGLLGGIGYESGRRMRKILNSLNNRTGFETSKEGKFCVTPARHSTQCGGWLAK